MRRFHDKLISSRFNLIVNFFCPQLERDIFHFVSISFTIFNLIHDHVNKLNGIIMIIQLNWNWIESNSIKFYVFIFLHSIQRLTFETFCFFVVTFKGKKKIHPKVSTIINWLFIGTWIQCKNNHKLNAINYHTMMKIIDYNLLLIDLNIGNN